MKNITVEVPDEIYARAAAHASELSTSLDGLVRACLTQLAEGNSRSDFEELRREQNRLIASIRGFKGGERLTREQIHERNALR